MKFEEYASSFNFVEKNNIFVREIDGYNFYLKDWEYLIYNIPSIFVCLDHEIDKDTLKKFEQAALNNACSTTTITSKNDTLIISLPEGNKQSEKTKETVESILARVVKLCKLENYKPLNICPVCKLEAQYNRFGDNYTPIHDECLNSYKEKLKKLVEENKKITPRHFISILVSLITSLIGLIPALLLCIFNYNYPTPLLALVPLFSVGSYYFINASPKKFLKLATSIIPAIIILVFSLISIPYMVKMNQLTFVEYLTFDKLTGIRKILFSSLFLFGGFGMMKIVGTFKKDNEKELKKF